ncbi:MAG: late competence development ComFB family protein [Cyanobacteria bacterium]|nr:late competence development ComFB family protein [Cyanobacteria bacterium CG_2015-16_32_12]NCO78870.1 late competence development ComFB family protein [Cyanobacteria bacterium CG_2015-22_32_23]NCQ05111.1 late competence development ComFB family protein [Cyanobacteria bacterium CG_2015-09_32_10]NCS85792.1 late competence development ComFB family protein [Cyanobacteria bacterium CG_2015-02_32_10]
MEINQIVNQALETGYLTPTMEAEVGKLCETSSELSLEEYVALDKLMGALLTGEVLAMPRKQFINVMEELVVSEVISRVAEIETSSSRLLDVGDISAYALNRLPPLYATTEEGANFQREKAKEELKNFIVEQVEQSISLYLDRPEFYPERHAINKSKPSDSVFTQVTQLLQSQASNYETH